MSRKRCEASLLAAEDILDGSLEGLWEVKGRWVVSDAREEVERWGRGAREWETLRLFLCCGGVSERYFDLLESSRSSKE